MRRIEFLIDQLNRSFHGDPWHGPSLQKLIDGVGEPEAKEHPLPGRHSIFELVTHITTWIDVVARRIAGEVVDGNNVTEGCDPATPWPRIAGELERAHARLCDAIARLTDADLGKSLPGARRSIESEILGVLQHNDYHAGQIAILKKSPRTS